MIRYPNTLALLSGALLLAALWLIVRLIFPIGLP